MDADRWAVTLTVGVVVLASVASGPMVGAVDLTHEPDVVALDPGNGSVTVTDVRVPEEDFRLERGRFGSGVVYLESPPVRVDTADLEGQPILTYKVRMEELRYVGFRAYFLGEEVDEAGGLDVQLPRKSLNVSDRSARSYRAEVIVVIRDNAGTRVVHRQNVTVEVGG